MSLVAVFHKPFDVISVNDAAIERETIPGRTALGRYMRERDTELLQLLPGGQPTVFKCRPLTHKMLGWIDLLPDELQPIGGFRCGVTDVVGLDAMDPPWRATQVQVAWSETESILSEESVEQLSDVGLRQIVKEIGLVCIQRVQLLPSQKKAYRLPPGYVVAEKNGSPATGQTSAPQSGRS